MYLSSIDEIVKHYKKEPIHENILLGSPIPKVSRSHLLLITDIYFTLCVEIRSIAIWFASDRARRQREEFTNFQRETQIC